jgi:hypothetical protein
MANEDALNNVRRKINEVLKKGEDRIVVGWRPGLEEKREEGDVWEARDGTTWTVKNGIKQNVTKLDTAKTPFWCPKCTKPMNHRFDLKFWRIRGHCMDCNIKFETEMRRNGTWEAYEQKLMKANYVSMLKDKLMEIEDAERSLGPIEIINADEQNGNILLTEKWEVDVDTIRTDMLKDINFLRQRIKDMEEEQDEQNITTD